MQGRILPRRASGETTYINKLFHPFQRYGKQDRYVATARNQALRTPTENSLTPTDLLVCNDASYSILLAALF
jgi:hypothetical protein